MSGTSINIRCSECGHTTTFPQSMGNREVFHTFCGNCSKVTSHNILSAPPTSAARKTATKDDSLKASPLPQQQAANSPQANRFGYSGGGSNRRPTQQDNAASPHQAVDIDDDELWRILLKKLDETNITTADLMRCNDEDCRRLFEALGYDRLNQQRLFNLRQERDPRNFIPAVPVPEAVSPAPVAESTTNPSNVVSRTPSNVNKSGKANSQYGLNSNASNFSNQPSPFRPSAGRTISGSARRRHDSPRNKAPTQSLIHGLSQQGDQLIARCTVYPDLPAEFWCCACNALVSSRCHVVGIHKDHPFITLRLAAESHVRDVASWAERCRTQLNITENVIGNLRHAGDVIDHNVDQQYDILDKHVDQIVNDLYAWRDQIKNDIAIQTESEHRSILQSVDQAQDMFDLFAEQLHVCEPLLNNMPPSDQSDRSSEDWALRFLDFVSKLKLVNADPIAMPRILIPEIRCTFTPTTATELLKQVNNPVGVRLPDIVDPGYFHYPQPTTSTRTPFILNMPSDGRQKGVVIENNRSLTRTQDVAPSHLLVSGSQIFYSGVTSWEVHVDKMGHGMGRVLAGVVIHGSDGEGVVWDGHRIVGPNEGETRTLSDKFKLKPGSILRFVLELDTPQSFLNCFFEREGVARIPLPAASSGWVPAFSVFGPQDQITVVPTQGAGAMEGSIPKNSSLHPSLRADGSDTVTTAKIQQQELLIASLQQQLNSINQRMVTAPQAAGLQQQQQGFISGATPGTAEGSPIYGGSVSPSNYRGRSARALGGGLDTSLGAATDPAFHRSVSQQSGGLRGSTRGAAAAAPVAAAADDTESISASAANNKKSRQSTLSYSPELEQLLSFANSIE